MNNTIRKISADYLFPVTSKPLKNGILEIDANGKIVNIIDTGGNLSDTNDIEFYNGILVPGFINTHCHLELSHLKNKIPEKRGLSEFIKSVQQNREISIDEQEKQMQIAENEMLENGIVAVGDISNFDNSFKIKEKSKLKYHTFIEIFGFNPDDAEKIFDKAKNLKTSLNTACSIVPHAPYSVSKKLLKLITNEAYINNGILSMHNQETESENEMFISGKGILKEALSGLDVDFNQWNPTGFSSVQSTVVNLSKCNKLILVHNTYTTEKDINWLINYFYPPENKTFQKQKIHLLYMALCPKANLYIENKLPNIPLFLNKGLKLTLGTDSLASNHALNILAEIKILQLHFPEIMLTEMLKWACINGAEALGFNKKLGSFEIGKSPGINLIDNIDFTQMKLSNQSKVKVIA